MEGILAYMVVLGLMGYAFANILCGPTRAKQMGPTALNWAMRFAGWLARVTFLTSVNTACLGARLITARTAADRANAFAVFAERMADAMLP